MTANQCRACMCPLSDPSDIIQIFGSTYKAIFDLSQMISDIFNAKIEIDDEITTELCISCAEKLVETHHFYVMYRESERKLREHLTEQKENKKSKQIEEENKHIEQIFVEAARYQHQPVSQTPKWECLVCMERFRSQRCLRMHQRNCGTSPIVPSTSVVAHQYGSVDKMEENKICIKVDDIKLEETASMQSDDEDFQCYKCRRFYSSMETLKSHKKICRMDKSEDSRSKTKNSDETANLICEKCGELHQTKEALKSHHKLYHSGKRTETPFKVKNPDANGNWICEKCGEPCTSKILLREHRKTHREPKQYTENAETGQFICDVCSKSFDSKEKIQVHVRRHGDIRCLCNMCGKWLSCLGNLRKHYKAVHLNERKLVCHICDHRFTSSFRLKDHINSHKGIRAYSCKLCPTRFFNYSAVKRHMDTVHSDEKKYVCNICSKAFKVPNNLKTHMFAHTGIYEHTCEHCGTGFRRKNKMMQHIREMHGVEA